MKISMPFLIALALLVAPFGLRPEGSGLAKAGSPTDVASPAFLPDGRLVFPAQYREWIFLSSGLDMSYTEAAPMAGASMFDNVFVNPQAYREFERTGTWPDPTLLVMEARGGSTRGSINKRGKFQSEDLMGVEVHVKDLQRFAGGWAFFAFDGTQPAQQIEPAAPCYSCHREHGAVDTTFVQFYPTLSPIARQKGTWAPGYKP
jgi:hypothetical protein